MAKPYELRVKMFNVGFGDCFLLSFVYDEKDKRHVLIDFGTDRRPEHTHSHDKQKGARLV